MLAFSKGAFAAAAAILSPLLAAVLSSNSKVEIWEAVLYLLGALAAGTGGVVFASAAAATEIAYGELVDVSTTTQDSSADEVKRVVVGSDGRNAWF